jgi:putative intracellular protease/amidase
LNHYVDPHYWTAAIMPKRRVLIVTTSHAELGSTGHRTGVWLEELAAPYLALRDAGVELTVASIRGGEIPFDPRSTGKEQSDVPVPATARRFLQDSDAMTAAKHSLSVDEVDAASPDAIYLPGGHGAMWDMPNSLPLARIVGSLFDTGRIVSAVCHGPAGLVSVKRHDGRPLVEGKRVNSFTNSEEQAVGLAKVVPFLLQTRLSELGGRFEGGPDWQPKVVRDGNLITGQNPMSSDLLARTVIEALETAPGRRHRKKEEL